MQNDLFAGTTKSHADHILETMRLSPGRWTVSDLVVGHPKHAIPNSGCGLSASEVRRILGWLFGQGRVKILGMSDGEPVWGPSSCEDMLKF